MGCLMGSFLKLVNSSSPPPPVNTILGVKNFILTDLISPVTSAVPLPTTPPPFCSEGDLREVSRDYSFVRSMYGTYQSIVDYRLEVCIGGEYTSICDIGWDDRDAAVACVDVRSYFEGGECKCDDLY